MEFSIVKILAFLFIFFFQLKSQQIGTTTFTIDDIMIQQEENLQFRFEYTPKEIDIPTIEYEDIEPYYQQFFSSDINKLKLNYQILSLQSLNKRDIKILAGEKNYFVLANIKNLQREFDIKYEKINTGIDKSYIDFNYNLSYYKTFDTLTLKNNFLYFVKFLTNVNNQINYELEISKVIGKNMILSFSPLFQYNYFVKENLSILFNKNELNLDLIFTNKTMTNLKIINFNDSAITISSLNFIFKNFIIENSYLNFSFGHNEKTKKFLYGSEFYKSFSNLEISFSFKKDVYYEFIKEYFIKFPELHYIKEEIIKFPEIENLETNLGYNYKGLKINFLFRNTFYNYYPSYNFSNNFIYTYFIKDQKIDYIMFKIFFPFKKSKFNLETEHIISSTKSIFLPSTVTKFTFETSLKNTYFLQTFLYNGEMQINNYEKLEKRIISNTELQFFISKDFSIDTKLVIPVAGKNYLIPNTYYPAYFLTGINLKFK